MTGKVIVKNHVCPSDKTDTVPVVGETGDQPKSEDAFSSWQSNGNSYAINWYWNEYPTGGGNYVLEDVGSTPGMSTRGSKMLKDKLGGRAAEFVLFYECSMDAFMLNARPPGFSPPSPFTRGIMGWHHKYSTYTMGFLDGHSEYKFFDTRYTRGPGINTWPGP